MGSSSASTAPVLYTIWDAWWNRCLRCKACGFWCATVYVTSPLKECQSFVVKQIWPHMFLWVLFRENHVIWSKKRRAAPGRFDFIGLDFCLCGLYGCRFDIWAAKMIDDIMIFHVHAGNPGYFPGCCVSQIFRSSKNSLNNPWFPWTGWQNFWTSFLRIIRTERNVQNRIRTNLQYALAHEMCGFCVVVFVKSFQLSCLVDGPQRTRGLFRWFGLVWVKTSVSLNF